MVIFTIVTFTANFQFSFISWLHLSPCMLSVLFCFLSLHTMQKVALKLILKNRSQGIFMPKYISPTFVSLTCLFGKACVWRCDALWCFIKINGPCLTSIIMVNMQRHLIYQFPFALSGGSGLVHLVSHCCNKDYCNALSEARPETQSSFST